MQAQVRPQQEISLQWTHADFMANLSFKIAEKVALQDFVQQQGHCKVLAIENEL